MDEPTASLDINSEKDLLENLNLGQFKTIIVVTHRMSMLDLVDRIIVLANGSVVLDGEKDEVLMKLRQKDD